MATSRSSPHARSHPALLSVCLVPWRGEAGLGRQVRGWVRFSRPVKVDLGVVLPACSGPDAAPGAGPGGKRGAPLLQGMHTAATKVVVPAPPIRAAAPGGDFVQRDWRQLRCGHDREVRWLRSGTAALDRSPPDGMIGLWWVSGIA
ncbi:MAG: hypothetical protein QOH56_4305 [Pseudonocardiales bacterium]|nr:hypothetical protein [Pseudonocardiales bacterium]